jgi:hypothetical protein
MTALAWPSAPPTLTDGLVTLRAWAPRDASAVFEACQDGSIQRWTRIPVPYEGRHATGFVGELAEQQWSSHQGAPFASREQRPYDLPSLFLGLVISEPHGE